MHVARWRKQLASYMAVLFETLGEAEFELGPLIERCDGARATHTGLARRGRGRIFLPHDRQARRAALSLLMTPGNANIGRALLALGRATVCETALVREIARLAGQSQGTTSIALGAPGPWRKDVVIVMDEHQRAVALGKVAATIASSTLIENEVCWLRELRSQEADGKWFPLLLHTGVCASRKFLIQRILPGSRSTVTLSRQVAALQSRIQAVAPASCGYVGSAMRGSLLERRQRLHDLVPVRWRERMDAVLEVLERRLTRSDIPMVVAHRDFIPGNLVVNMGELGVFDWEYARYEWLPLNDLFHFMLMPVALTRDLTISDVRKVMRDALWAGGLLGEGLRKCQAPDVQLLAYLLDMCLMRLEFDVELSMREVVVSRYSSLIDAFPEWRCCAYS